MLGIVNIPSPRAVWRWTWRHMPELLLGVFALGLAPGLLFGGLALTQQLGAFYESPSGYWTGVEDNPLPALAVLVCLLAGVTLALVMWRSWTFIWAVARKMILEALHRKVVLVLLIFFVVLMLLLPFVLKTEGSMKSQVQLVLLYSTVLAMVLLSLVAIFVSAASICSEVDRKYVQVTDTKPMRRWQFLLGKWFGVVVLCTGVLFAMSAAAFVLVMSLVRVPDTARMTADEAAKASADFAAVLQEVLVARKTVISFEPPGIEEGIRRDLKAIEEEGEMPSSRVARRKMREALRKNNLIQALTVKPGGMLMWEFAGLSPASDSDLFVRFHGFTSTLKSHLVGRWDVLHMRMAPDEQGNMSKQYRYVLTIYAPEFGWFTAAQREFRMPAYRKMDDGPIIRTVAPDGTLVLVYYNLDDRAAATFHGAQRVQIMQAEGTFLANYYRSLLIILCHIALLSGLGLMAGAVFSFPVASLTVGFFFIIGLVGPWFVSFTEVRFLEDLTVTQEIIHTLWSGGVKGFLAVMPHFGKFSPLGDLTDGKMVGWGRVASAAAMMVFIKAAAAVLLGMYFYSRRELARVIV